MHASKRVTFINFAFDPAHVAKYVVLFLTPLRRIDGSTNSGICVSYFSRPRLIGNEIWGNHIGLHIDSGGDPFLSGNTIRDHAGVDGVGVLVARTSHGLTTIRPDNVFLRNAGGDVVREPMPD